MSNSCMAKTWNGYSIHACGKPAKFGNYCGIHNPERIAQKRLNESHPLLVAALENLLAAIDGHRVTIGDCNQAVAALKAAKGEE